MAAIETNSPILLFATFSFIEHGSGLTEITLDKR